MNFYHTGITGYDLICFIILPFMGTGLHFALYFVISLCVWNDFATYFAWIGLLRSDWIGMLWRFSKDPGLV